MTERLFLKEVNPFKKERWFSLNFYSFSVLFLDPLSQWRRELALRIPSLRLFGGGSRNADQEFVRRGTRFENRVENGRL